MATEDGRVTLSEMRLITTTNGNREERQLKNETEYVEVLRDVFGIVAAPNKWLKLTRPR
jgi:arylamine N-acetyltransferase